MEHKIWYSIQNDGAGSAYSEFMASEKLCKIDQRFMEEGWGDDATGCLVIVAEGPITVKGLITVDSAIKEVEEELDQDYMRDYRSAGKYPGMFICLDGKLAALRELKRCCGGPRNEDSRG